MCKIYPHSFFNYETYKQLIDKISEIIKKTGVEDAREDLEWIEDQVKCFHGYVNEVNMGETRITIAYTKYEGADLREVITEIDRSRHNAHERAISGCSIINRLAMQFDIAPIFTGDIKDRLQVADFCIEVVETLFKNRKI